MKISEMITDKYKLRIPPTVYYELLADVQEAEEEQEPTTKNDLVVDCVARQDVERYIEGFINEYTSREELEFINLELDGLKHIPSVTPQLSSELEKNSKKLEKNFGELDCIKKSDAINIIQDMHGLARADVISDAVNRIIATPSVTPQEPKIVPIVEIKCDEDKLKELVDKAVLTVTPQEPKCKDCKWWKDSDGEYRRGCGAESQCPINRREVYEGNGYCYLFEPQESEDNK